VRLPRAREPYHRVARLSWAFLDPPVDPDDTVTRVSRCGLRMTLDGRISVTSVTKSLNTEITETSVSSV
jgi:hypothetical protein